MKKVEKSALEIWLFQHGGREEKDVQKDGEGNSYINLFNPYTENQVERIYVPKRYYDVSTT